jgi:hypothetical protein
MEGLKNLLDLPDDVLVEIINILTCYRNELVRLSYVRSVCRKFDTIFDRYCKPVYFRKITPLANTNDSQLMSISNFIQRFSVGYWYDKTNIVRNMTNLTSLTINSKHTTGKVFLELPKLSCVILGPMNISVTNDDLIMIATRLTKLSLHIEPQITSDGLIKLTNLTNLKLWGTLTITDDAISKLTNLKKITLKWNSDITGKCLLNLPVLEELNIRSNTSVRPDYVSVLVNLKRLIVHNNMMIFPEHIIGLTNLSYLDITQSGHLHHMSIYSMPSLRYIRKGLCHRAVCVPHKWPNLNFTIV